MRVYITVTLKSLLRFFTRRGSGKEVEVTAGPAASKRNSLCDVQLEVSTREQISRSLPLRFPPMSAVCDFELSQALDG